MTEMQRDLLPTDVPERDPGAAPVRSVRRAVARRASNRRAAARTFQLDASASIMDYLAHHPGSTAGVIAKGLNLNPDTVAPRLTQLEKAGEIKRASHGYYTAMSRADWTLSHAVPDERHPRK